MRSVTDSSFGNERTAFPTDEAYLKWGRVMLQVYKDMADLNICQAEKMLTDAMALREAANLALDRAAKIAEGLARVVDKNEPVL